MQHRLRLVSCALLLAGILLTPCVGQEPPKAPPPPPPLKREQIEALMAAGVSSLDILHEAERRKLDFDVTGEVVAAWEKAGIDLLLLNHLPQYSLLTNQELDAAKGLIEQKKYNDAATVLGKILQPTRSPRCLIAVALRGLCFRKTKEYDRAVKDFVTALKFDPNDVENYRDLGAALAEAGKFSESEKVLTQMMKEFPQRAASVRANLAKIHEQSGQFNEAISDLLIALQDDPANPELLTRLAILHASIPGSASVGDSAAREFALAAMFLAPDRGQPQFDKNELKTSTRLAMFELRVRRNNKSALRPKSHQQIREYAIYLLNKAKSPDDSAFDDTDDDDQFTPKEFDEYQTLWKQRRVWALQSEALIAAMDGKFTDAATLQGDAANLAKDLGVDVISDELIGDIEAVSKCYAEKKRFQLPPRKTGTQAIFSLDSRGTAELLINQLVSIPGGKFQMGSKNGAPDEKPVREVTLKPFRLSAHEVTNAEWAAIMVLPLAGPPDAAHENVSWEECQKFITQLNNQVQGEVVRFRLPTEEEWEYAARAGTTTEFSFGDDSSLLREHGWHDANSKGVVNPVAQLQKNAFGLYDMHGNVAEWCQDVYGPYGSIAVATAGVDQSLHVVRGGSRRQPAAQCRSAARGFATAKDRLRGIGFRLAADSNGDVAATAKTQPSEPSSRGLRAVMDHLDDSGASYLTDGEKRHLRAIVYLLLGYVMLERQNEKAAIAAFEESQNKAIPRGLDTDKHGMLMPDIELIARCSSAWIRATSTDPAVQKFQQADEEARKANEATRYSNWLPYVVRAAANAALKNWTDARKWEDNAYEQAKSPNSMMSPRLEDSFRIRKELYGKNEPSAIRPLPFPIDEYFFPHE